MRSLILITPQRIVMQLPLSSSSSLFWSHNITVWFTLAVICSISRQVGQKKSPLYTKQETQKVNESLLKIYKN